MRCCNLLGSLPCCYQTYKSFHIPSGLGMPMRQILEIRAIIFFQRRLFILPPLENKGKNIHSRRRALFVPLDREKISTDIHLSGLDIKKCSKTNPNFCLPACNNSVLLQLSRKMAAMLQAVMVAKAKFTSTGISQ